MMLLLQTENPDGITCQDNCQCIDNCSVVKTGRPVEDSLSDNDAIDIC